MSTASRETIRFHIKVNISKGQIKVSPDPAFVDQGTVVGWYFVVEPGLPSVNLEVYFSNGSPTGWQSKNTKAQLSERGSTPTPSVIEAVAKEPGDYKYGVKAVSLGTKEVIADDDPYLIVRPKRN
ncbi:MAG: hypothetical protein ACREBG_11575 [Pyrinomonadaceae bacterium]